LHTHQAVQTFAELPFNEDIKKDLAAAGYVAPTPIQAAAIPVALEGRDLIGLAQTGTGKTAAFALPIIHRLARRQELGALVLAPTRELVQQIVGVFRELGAQSGLRVMSVVGGVRMENDWKALRSWPNVIVATPGRLLDHLEQKTVTLQEIEIFVVDEADRMHDMGFIPQIRRIIAALPAKRQTMMFTATMPPDVERIVRQSMHDPAKIQVGPASRPVERAEQKLYKIAEEAKAPLLLDLLKKEDGRVLVFLRTKRGVDKLARRLLGRVHSVTRLHGDREQSQRDEAMAGFRSGKYKVLLATDIAARGLDVADIEHVINYDFPRSAEDYVHRIGRTARLAASGRATSFVTSMDSKYLHGLEKLLGAKIQLVTAPGATGAAEGEGSEGFSASNDRHEGGGRSGGGREGGGRSGGRRRGGRPGASGRGQPGQSHGHKVKSPGHAAQPHGHAAAPHGAHAEGQHAHGQHTQGSHAGGPPAHGQSAQGSHAGGPHGHGQHAHVAATPPADEAAFGFGLYGSIPAAASAASHAPSPSAAGQGPAAYSADSSAPAPAPAPRSRRRGPSKKVSAAAPPKLSEVALPPEPVAAAGPEPSVEGQGPAKRSRRRSGGRSRKGGILTGDEFGGAVIPLGAADPEGSHGSASHQEGPPAPSYSHEAPAPSHGHESPASDQEPTVVDWD
jgi:ATP-dependent RNA helicase RhlE